MNEGKIRFYGWSTDDADRAKEFAKSKHCTTIQYVLSIFRINSTMTRLCEENNLAGIIRSPFLSGTLTGKYNKETKCNPDHMLGKRNFNTQRYVRMFHVLDQIKDRLALEERTLVQGILGYIWKKDKRSIPIPGAKTVNQMTENAKSL